MESHWPKALNFRFNEKKMKAGIINTSFKELEKKKCITLNLSGQLSQLGMAGEAPNNIF